jgi:hypothetical protein
MLKTKYEEFRKTEQIFKYVRGLIKEELSKILHFQQNFPGKRLSVIDRDKVLIL